MKALLDPDRTLAGALGRIRTEFQVPAGSPSSVLAASTDLDLAFAIARAGSDSLPHSNEAISAPT